MNKMFNSSAQLYSHSSVPSPPNNPAILENASITIRAGLIPQPYRHQRTKRNTKEDMRTKLQKKTFCFYYSNEYMQVKTAQVPTKISMFNFYQISFLLRLRNSNNKKEQLTRDCKLFINRYNLYTILK